jgi:hypothetical protein
MKRAKGKQYPRYEDGDPVSRVSSGAFQIRRATGRDADIIAWHRARMFQDMGDVWGDAFEILRAKARTRLEQWIDRGRYIGWLASPVDKPKVIVGGRCAVATDSATPSRGINNRRRPAGNDCKCFYRTAMATARYRGPAC